MRFVPSGFFVLRTPLLPFETLLDWADASDGGQHLRSIAARPEVAEALALASESMAAALNGDDTPPRKMLLALGRYVCRMSARPTPFGLMAGYTTGAIAGDTRLRFATADGHERVTEIGLHYLNRFCTRLASDPDVRSQASLRPASSLYEVAGQFRYVESHETFDGRGYQLQAVRGGRELRTALALARSGLTAGELSEALARELGASVEAVRAYVDQLVENQILAPDLFPRVTVDDALSELADRLSPIPAGTALRGLHDELRRIDALGTGIDVAEYDALRRTSAALFPDVPFDNLLHVALRKPGDIQLGRDAADRILRGVEILRRLFGNAEQDPVRKFRDRFVERYESRFVPLLEALDEELGIGFSGYGEDAADDSPLLQDLAFPQTTPTPRALPCDRILFDKVGRALRSGARELVLTDDDVERMSLPSPLPLPETFAVIASVGARDIVLHTVLGPSGARLFGRFCQGDRRLEELVRDHLRAEERLRPDAVFAEAVNLPHGRSANIIARPPLRDYDLPYLGESGLPAERQIVASDLLVGIRENRIVLWSKTLDREVIPRVTSAHNVKSHGVSVYRFLATVARQGVASALFWDWGPLGDLPFLPRVRYENVVLSRATWFLRAEERQMMRDGTAAERLGMPRFVLFVDGDQELLIDLRNPMTIDAFLAAAGRRDVTILHELLPQPEDLVVESPAGRYTHEVVIPFHRAEPAPATAPATRPVLYRSEERVVAPGGAWAYFKLYTGYSTADRLLVDAVAPLVRRLRDEGRIRSWFFVRYRDPEFHLRVRLGGEPDVLWDDVRRTFSDALAPLLTKGWMTRVQLDTYVREIERYGGVAGVTLAEELFCADSDMVVSLLPFVQSDPDLRWQLAVVGTDALLDDLGFDTAGKARVLDRLVRLYGAELRADRSVRDRLARQTRLRRAALQSLFANASGPWTAPYRERSARVRPLVAAMHDLDTGFDELASSTLHMHLNRWFRSTPRVQEFVVYDLLHRRLLSQLARERAASPAVTHPGG